MEMNEILNGLNSCGSGDDDFSCGSVGNTGCSNNGCNSGFGGGSWIWILLILFYTCSGSGSRNRGGGCCPGYECVCKCEKKKEDCCCNQGCGMEKSKGGCSSYLFLLVLLFLCNRCGDNSSGGFGGFGLGCC